MDKDKLVNIFRIDKPNICFVGDIHGEFKGLQGLMKRTGFRDTAYIVCGDIGLGFNKKEYYSQIFNKLTRTASKLNCEFIFIRGNHDNKVFFDKRLINRKCFKTVPDYSVLQTPTHNILCIGGAISIDRTYRKVEMRNNAYIYALHHGCSITEAEKLCKQLYWEDEACYYDEERISQLKLNGIDIDIVCTHTCPSFTKPIGKDNISYWLSLDKDLETDIDNERHIMDSVYKKLKDDGHSLKNWFYGHFHFHSTEYIDGTKFVMLDMFRNGNYDFYDVVDMEETIYV